ncbi:MAG: SAM-dependent chlorinase/fluorinase [Rhodospirillales bacterium]
MILFGHSVTLHPVSENLVTAVAGMFVLFTDFGFNGPYVGQMKAVLHGAVPGMPVIDLMHDAPPFDPQSCAYLLAALVGEFPKGAVFLTIVDPGVGTDRRALVVEADGRWFVGPDNGLLALVARRAGTVRAWEITWRPRRLSASFHGRDLFAPVAAGIGREGTFAGADKGAEIAPSAIDRPEWPDEFEQIVYIDAFGNLISGLRAEKLSPNHRILVHNVEIKGETTFASVSPGTLFWYANSNGLVEIACNRGRADQRLDIEVGAAIDVRGNQTVTVST